MDELICPTCGSHSFEIRIGDGGRERQYCTECEFPYPAEALQQPNGFPESPGSDISRNGAVLDADLFALPGKRAELQSSSLRVRRNR